MAFTSFKVVLTNVTAMLLRYIRVNGAAAHAAGKLLHAGFGGHHVDGTV